MPFPLRDAPMICVTFPLSAFIDSSLHRCVITRRDAPSARIVRETYRDGDVSIAWGVPANSWPSR